MNIKKNIAICFLGNLYFDTRTYNLFHSLKSKGHVVSFIGFDWLTPNFQTVKTDEISVLKLKKGRLSILFYLEFAIRTFVQLMRKDVRIIWAADFFVLPVCYLVGKIKRCTILFDSREVYTEISGFNNKPFIKKMVKIVEGFILHRISQTFTTGPLDSRHIEKLYDLPKTELLRNMPRRSTSENPVDYRTKLPEKLKGPVLVYQGTLVKGRGIEASLDILKKYPDCGLVLLGGGEHQSGYEKMAAEMGIAERIVFAGKIPQDQLIEYTAGADAGLCLIDNISGNNYYALPNKLFEYLMAGIPVLVTDLPQMKEIVDTFEVGAVIPENDIDSVVSVLKTWQKSSGTIRKLKANCSKASQILNWDNEFETIYHYFK